MQQIDTESYRKDTKHPPRWGYQARGGSVPISIIIHTTNNKRATTFDGEAIYLRDAAGVSAHFLIGKDGRIVQFLDPLEWQAWHAGECLPAFLNARSIGIEHHVSVGEAWTVAQRDACTWLVQHLMRVYSIGPALIETHRAVARPRGRKSDPEGWQDAAFYTWRATLAPEPPPPPPTKRYRARRMMISTVPEWGPPWAGELQPGEEVVIDKWYAATNTVHLEDERGFCRHVDLEPV